MSSVDIRNGLTWIQDSAHYNRIYSNWKDHALNVNLAFTLLCIGIISVVTYALYSRYFSGNEYKEKTSDILKGSGEYEDTGEIYKFHYNGIHGGTQINVDLPSVMLLKKLVEHCELITKAYRSGTIVTPLRFTGNNTGTKIMKGSRIMSDEEWEVMNGRLNGYRKELMETEHRMENLFSLPEIGGIYYLKCRDMNGNIKDLESAIARLDGVITNYTLGSEERKNREINDRIISRLREYRRVFQFESFRFLSGSDQNIPISNANREENIRLDLPGRASNDNEPLALDYRYIYLLRGLVKGCIGQVSNKNRDTSLPVFYWEEENSLLENKDADGNKKRKILRQVSVRLSRHPAFLISLKRDEYGWKLGYTGPTIAKEADIKANIRSFKQHTSILRNLYSLLCLKIIDDNEQIRDLLKLIGSDTQTIRYEDLRNDTNREDNKDELPGIELGIGDKSNPSRTTISADGIDNDPSNTDTTSVIDNIDTGI